MQRRFRQVICALKEHSSVKYAKVATLIGGFCDLDIIIVKATAPDDLPFPERYINELLNIFSISPSSFHSFSLSFTRRFRRTHCWKVAVKCLILLHRLLRSLPENSPFRAELLWARSNGLLSLYPCRFRDDSSSNPEDYTMFIRSYAQLLDEALNCFALDPRATPQEEEEEEEDMIVSLQDKMKRVSRMLEVLPQLQSLMDRVMECRPAGRAASSFVIQSAMKHIIRDSFNCYTTFRKEIVLVLDNLIQMPYKSCISSFGIYKKAAVQAEQLFEFYDWCKLKELCCSYEYPFIERIPEIQIRALETFLSGMWQLTDSSSSATSPSSWLEESNNSSSVDQDEERESNYKQTEKRDFAVSTNWVEFEENEEMKPLIQLEEDENDDNWEVLLDSSLVLSPNNLLSNGYNEDEVLGKEMKGRKNNQWLMQVYDPNATNPFCHPNFI